VQGHAFDTKPAAPLLEFGRPVGRSDGYQIWKEWSYGGAAAQNSLNGLIEANP
jgi:hypothetical protein